jgi:hypothetical protein
MKTRLIAVLASLLGLALLALVLVLGQAAPVQAGPDVLYVAPDASPPAGHAEEYATAPNAPAAELHVCAACPYTTIQAAVDAATAGDVIKVAAGTYTGVNVRSCNDVTTTGVVTQVVYVSKAVTIRGGYNADFSAWNPDVYSTTLDAQGQGRVIYIVGNISPTIEELHITGGDAAGLGGYDYYGIYDVGGGVYVMTATATLNSNQIFSNAASYGGGGVYLGYSTGMLDGNIVFNNTVSTGGGGMFLYKGSATLNGNRVISNTSDDLGGGLYLFSTDATLRGNTIAGNVANNFGGGVAVSSCSPTFSGNVVSGNAANTGGGLRLWYSHSILTNNVIADNRANVVGSGLWMGGSQPRLLHTTIARNTGGNGSGVLVTDAGATYSTLAMTNTVLVSHTVGISVTVGSTATLESVLWFGNGTNAGGAGTIAVTNTSTGDPAFAPDGYHLTAGSAAIDKGVSAGVTSDIDGQPRLGVPDLGADEYLKCVYLPLVMRNH